MPPANSHIYLIFNPWSGDSIYGGLGSMLSTDYHEMVHCLDATGKRIGKKEDEVGFHLVFQFKLSSTTNLFRKPKRDENSSSKQSIKAE
jgi:hypothetical protein